MRARKQGKFEVATISTRAGTSLSENNWYLGADPKMNSSDVTDKIYIQQHKSQIHNQIIKQITHQNLNSN